jgi:hypothetical protein
MALLFLPIETMVSSKCETHGPFCARSITSGSANTRRQQIALLIFWQRHARGSSGHSCRRLRLPGVFDKISGILLKSPSLPWRSDAGHKDPSSTRVERTRKRNLKISHAEGRFMSFCWLRFIGFPQRQLIFHNLRSTKISRASAGASPKAAEAVLEFASARGWPAAVLPGLLT